MKIALAIIVAALAILPDSRHKQALETLAHMAVQRSA